MNTAKNTENLTIKLLVDELSENPRKWCNLGTIVASHPRYYLGDDNGRSDAVQIITDHFTQAQLDAMDFDEKDMQSLAAALEATQKVVMWPMYSYEHGGIAISLNPFNCNWDGGCPGFVFVTKETLRKEYGWVRITARRKSEVRKIMDSEINTFNQYLNGDVWGYQALDETGEVVDACWGFYGFEPMKNGIRDSIPPAFITLIESGQYQRCY